MDNRPIGIFDSGVGGLAAVRTLRRILPGEDIIYFGDSGRMPYGGKPAKKIARIACQDADFLMQHGVKALMAACGTIGSNALPDVKAAVNVPVFGIIIPSAKDAVETTANGRIGVVATEATARSDAFGRAIADIDPSLEVTTLGCPLLAPLVESGHFDKNDEAVQDALAQYLPAMRDAGVDTLLLGCTHYAMLKAAITDWMGDKVQLVDAGAVGAESMARHLTERALLADEKREGRGTYYTSGDLQTFALIAELFLGEDIAGSVYKVMPFIF